MTTSELKLRLVQVHLSEVPPYALPPRGPPRLVIRHLCSLNGKLFLCTLPIRSEEMLPEHAALCDMAHLMSFIVTGLKHKLQPQAPLHEPLLPKANCSLQNMSCPAQQNLQELRGKFKRNV